MVFLHDNHRILAPIIMCCFLTRPTISMRKNFERFGNFVSFQSQSQMLMTVFVTNIFCRQHPPVTPAIFKSRPWFSIQTRSRTWDSPILIQWNMIVLLFISLFTIFLAVGCRSSLLLSHRYFSFYSFFSERFQ